MSWMDRIHPSDDGPQDTSNDIDRLIYARIKRQRPDPDDLPELDDEDDEDGVGPA